MKKILIRIVVLVLVFLAAAFGTSKFLNRGTVNTTEVMAAASFPLVYVDMDGMQVNCLHGYAKEMDVMAMRDTLTPIDGSRTVNIQIEPFQNQIRSVSFEVLTADGSKTLENTQVTSMGEKDDYVTAELKIQNKLLINTEYIMKIQIAAGSRNIYYYTRILHQEGLHAKDYVNFALGFYERCLSGNDVDGLISQTIEPDETGDNTNLAHMDIHCSGDQLMWGKLDPQIYLKPIPNIKELNENTATMELDYVITAQGDREEDFEMYHVTEYYRMRYLDRVMLLDFERDTNQLFDPEDAVLVSNGIRLGVSSRSITYKNDPEQKFFGFVQAGALWLYETDAHHLTQVFSFLQNGSLDARDIYDENDIKIINIDALGNMYFLVCGYMNRGRHEGECGAAVYYFDAAASSIRECIYVETQEAFGLLVKDVETLAYISDDKAHFYLTLEGTLYDIKLETQEAEPVLTNLNSGCYAGSVSGKMFAWLKENDRYDSATLKLLNLETQEEKELTCGEKERLCPIGFMDEDLVYGVAAVSDIDTEHMGSELFPMYKLLIVNAEGTTVKEYAPSDCYVTGGVIEDKLLTLERVKRTERGFEETSGDNIVNSVADKETAYGLAIQNTERKQKELILKTGEILKEGTKPQILYAQQIVSETMPQVAIAARERSEDLYYVYAKGRLDHIYPAVNEAVRRANDQLGVVVNSRQQLVWERGNKKTKRELDISSLPEIVLNGKMDLKKLRNRLQKEILNLRGCELSSVLYYVSEGTPVLAETADGVVIIVGYDEYNTILLKPGEAEAYYYGLEESEELFEKAGNVFVTYFDPIEE